MEIGLQTRVRVVVKNDEALKKYQESFKVPPYVGEDEYFIEARLKTIFEDIRQFGLCVTKIVEPSG